MKLLRGQRGSVGASVLFVMFSAVTMTAIMAVVLSTMNASSASRNYALTSASAAIKKAGYLGGLVLDPTAAPDTGDKTDDCMGKACGSVSSINASGNIVTLSLKGMLTGTGTTVDQDTVLRQVNANYIAGYDANGDPAWVNETGTTPHRFKEITSNGDFSCAIDTDTTVPGNLNTVWCWGSNVNGQLGDGTTSYSYEPVKIASNQAFADLSNGTSFGMCALTTAKKAYCWGNNSDGQSGGTNVGTFNATPQAIAGNRSYTQLVQAATTTCGIEDVTKLIYCWGENNGDALTSSSSTPVQVAGANQYVKMSMDRTSACALDTTSRILCWSSTGLGQVGVALASAGSTGMEGFTITTAGYRQGAPAIVPAGQDKDTDGSLSPEDLGAGWADITVGNEERDDMKSVVCALKTTGTAWCWGSNTAGQLGNGSKIDAVTPVQVAGGKVFSKLAVSPEGVCGIQKVTNKLWCWGANDYGQVGDGSGIATPLPVAVDTTTTYKTIQAATGNKKWFCGISSTDQVKCWGRNSFGQMYTGGIAAVNTPKAIQSISPAAELSLGDHFACILDSTGIGTCWGRNNIGQAGGGFRSPVAPSLNEWTGPTQIAEQPFTFPGFTGYVTGGAQ